MPNPTTEQIQRLREAIAAAQAKSDEAAAADEANDAADIAVETATANKTVAAAVFETKREQLRTALADVQAAFTEAFGV